MTIFSSPDIDAVVPLGTPNPRLMCRILIQLLSPSYRATPTWCGKCGMRSHGWKIPAGLVHYCMRTVPIMSAGNCIGT